MSIKANPVLSAKAITDETRQKIMSVDCCHWLSVNEIVEKMNVAQPLSSLREEGKQTFYSLNQEHFATC